MDTQQAINATRKSSHRILRKLERLEEQLKAQEVAARMKATAEDCPICLNPLNDRAEVALECGHTIHLACFLPMVGKPHFFLKSNAHQPIFECVV